MHERLRVPACQGFKAGDILNLGGRKRGEVQIFDDFSLITSYFRHRDHMILPQALATGGGWLDSDAANVNPEEKYLKYAIFGTFRVFEVNIVGKKKLNGSMCCSGACLESVAKLFRFQNT
jgi:hypothetical protein